MKKRNLISIILALLLALQWITPALASEEDIPPEPGEAVEAPEVLPEVPAPEEPEDTQPPEDVSAPDDIPDIPQPPEDVPPDESQPPEDVADPEEDIQEP